MHRPTLARYLPAGIGARSMLSVIHNPTNVMFGRLIRAVEHFITVSANLRQSFIGNSVKTGSVSVLFPFLSSVRLGLRRRIVHLRKQKNRRPLNI